MRPHIDAPPAESQPWMQNSKKKMLVPDILSILKRYSDEQHYLSQREIAEPIERDYGMNVWRTFRIMKRTVSSRCRI